ncbi:MAG TPA: hypothetical protein VII01_13440 [Solirubrobacteraceae bacterium]
MNGDVNAALDRAAKRCDWASRALKAAADELDQASEEGMPVGSTADLARTEAACARELARRIADVRALAGSDRRVRDGL